ncbi:MAG: 30S ribosome-binding factor RbfA [Balneolaceae bacterium]|nr:30S ribosome-binding factor RbfA [Balneolaceae bacterium]
MSFRPKRLAEVVKRDLGSIIQKDYQPEGTFVTVTKVTMTPDLMIAKVYLSVFSPGRDDKAVYEYIDDHIQEIRYKLASKIRNQVRKIPELHFYVDKSAEYIDKMERLLDDVDIPEKDSDNEEG